MSAISTILTRLRAAIWAIDVRDDIADAIEQCYSDVSNPTLKTEALEAALQNKIDEGEMAALTIGDHTITAAKLAQGVIDNTLATSGAAADAKKTGDELSALKADLGTQTGIISKTPGYYINLTTDPVDISNPSASSTGLTYSIIDCSEGDKFVINAVGATSVRAWGFLDSSNRVLSMADANATVTDLELTAPTNAVKLIINDKGGGTSYKVGNNLASEIGNIKKGGSGLSNEAKAALLACFNHVVWDTDDYDALFDDLETALYSSAAPVPVYSLSQPLECNGNTYVSTGVKLYDTQRDYTVLLDVTSPTNDNTQLIETIVDCMNGEDTPFPGLFISKWKYDATKFRYSIIQSPRGGEIREQAYNSGSHRLKLAVRAKVSDGIADIRGTVDGQTAIIATGSTKAFSVVDKYVGLGGQIKMNGTMYTDRYFKGTINDCKIYYEYLSNYDVQEFLS